MGLDLSVMAQEYRYVFKQQNPEKNVSHYKTVFLPLQQKKGDLYIFYVLFKLNAAHE